MFKLSSLFGIVAVVLLGTALADDIGRNPGYLSTPYANADSTSVVKSAYGSCIRNGYYQPSYGQEACGDSQPAKKVITTKVSYSESGTSLFNFNASTLSKAGKNELSELLSTTQNDAPIDSIMVVGYTDIIGANDYNQQLGQQRANVVRNFLIAQGVESGTITAIGKGSLGAQASASCVIKYGTNGIDELDRITTGYFKKTASDRQAIDAKLAQFANKHRALVNCMASDRRVEIVIKQSKEVTASN